MARDGWADNWHTRVLNRYFHCRYWYASRTHAVLHSIFTSRHYDGVREDGANV